MRDHGLWKELMMGNVSKAQLTNDSTVRPPRSTLLYSTHHTSIYPSLPGAAFSSCLETSVDNWDNETTGAMGATHAV